MPLQEKSHPQHDFDSELGVSIEREKSQKPIPPPDVGITPWLQVLGGFFLMFDSWGVIFTYGVFQSYFENGGLVDSSSPSDIAWAGSLQSFLLLFAGAFTAKFIDTGHHRAVLLLGTFLTVFGVMMASLATRLYQVILSLGLCVGLGISMFIIMSLAVVPTWFVKRRGLAMGIVTSGTSVGGVVLPIMLQRLINSIGYGWAVRVYGFVILATLLMSIFMMRPRLPPRPRPRLIEYPALKDPAFALYVGGMFIAVLGLFVYFTFVEQWLIVSKIDTKGLDPFYILAIANGAGLFGRLIPGILTDYFGGLNMQSPSILISGILVLCWISVNSIGGAIAIAVLYGFFSGGVFGLVPMAVASMTEDLSTLPGRVAVCSMAFGAASLIGSPVAGAIVQSQNGTYDGARIWAGVVTVVGGIIVVTGRFVRTKGKIVIKV
jgi:MFS family permease